MKVKTMDLKGKAYAQVKDRLKEFRQENPNGLIETTPTIQPDGQILFKARILKDKSNEASAEGTGHALGKDTGAKAFEKLETVAIGRALANLGYLIDGAIASTDEIEEFQKYKQEKKEEAMDALRSAKSQEKLKDIFLSLGNLMADKDIIKLKDELKKKYANN